MAKFSGKIAFGSSSETNPGVWTDTITEREYTGDVLREARQWQDNQKVNSDLAVSNRLSIVADDFAYENLSTMKYAIWSGAYWEITNVEVQRPRLILSLGGVYHGPKPT